jgi:hypothetical protein
MTAKHANWKKGQETYIDCILPVTEIARQSGTHDA